MWPEFKGRDGCRTPMAWDAAAAAGRLQHRPRAPGCRSRPSTCARAGLDQARDAGSLLPLLPAPAGLAPHPAGAGGRHHRAAAGRRRGAGVRPPRRGRCVGCGTGAAVRLQPERRRSPLHLPPALAEAQPITDLPLPHCAAARHDPRAAASRRTVRHALVPKKNRGETMSAIDFRGRPQALRQGAAWTPSARSTSTSRTASSSSSSAPRAAASRRCCAWSRGWRTSAAASSASRASASTRRRPRAAASRWCSRATRCTRT